MTTVHNGIANSSVSRAADSNTNQKHDMEWLMGLYIITRRLGVDQYAARTQELLAFTRANEAILKQQEDQDHRVTSIAPELEHQMEAAKTPEAINEVGTKIQVASLKQVADQAQVDNAASHVRQNDQLGGMLGQQNQMTQGEIVQAGELFISANKTMNVTLTQTIFR